MRLIICFLFFSIYSLGLSQSYTYLSPADSKKYVIGETYYFFWTINAPVSYFKLKIVEKLGLDNATALASNPVWFDTTVNYVLGNESYRVDPSKQPYYDTCYVWQVTAYNSSNALVAQSTPRIFYGPFFLRWPYVAAADYTIFVDKITVYDFGNLAGSGMITYQNDGSSWIKKHVDFKNLVVSTQPGWYGVESGTVNLKLDTTYKFIPPAGVLDTSYLHQDSLVYKKNGNFAYGTLSTQIKLGSTDTLKLQVKSIFQCGRSSGLPECTSTINTSFSINLKNLPGFRYTLLAPSTFTLYQTQISMGTSDFRIDLPVKYKDNFNSIQYFEYTNKSADPTFFSVSYTKLFNLNRNTNITLETKTASFDYSSTKTIHKPLNGVSDGNWMGVVFEDAKINIPTNADAKNNIVFSQDISQNAYQWVVSKGWGINYTLTKDKQYLLTCKGLNGYVDALILKMNNDTIINSFLRGYVYSLDTTNKKKYSFKSIITNDGFGVPVLEDTTVSFDSLRFIPEPPVDTTDTSHISIAGYTNGCTVYPNPASTLLNVQTCGEKSVFSIYSITGSCIYKQVISGQDITPVDISSMTRGGYIVTLEKPEGEIYYRKTIQIK